MCSKAASGGRLSCLSISVDGISSSATAREMGGGVPLHLRDAIWPEGVEALGRQKTDVLVCHEGLTSVWQDMGFAVIDELAVRMKARLIVHGHHHHNSQERLPNGFVVKSLGKAEVWRLREEFGEK